jgi:hypothetical protein
MGNMYEIQQNAEGEWDILKQGRHEITFSTRDNALTLVQYIIRQREKGLSA